MTFYPHTSVSTHILPPDKINKISEIFNKNNFELNRLVSPTKICQNVKIKYNWIQWLFLTKDKPRTKKMVIGFLFEICEDGISIEYYGTNNAEFINKIGFQIQEKLDVDVDLVLISSQPIS